MQLRTRVIAAGIAGVIAMLLLYQREREVEKNAFGGDRVEILIAKAEIKGGGRIKETDVGTLRVPELYLHPQAISARDAGQILGRQLALPVKANQPLLWTDFGSTERDRPGAAVPKGLRGTVVAVNELIGKSGLVGPGDRVDVLATFGGQQELKLSMTVTLLQNVPLIEITGTTAMLALELDQAELLTFSAQHGQLSLLLRNAEDLDVKKDIPPKSFKSLIEQIRELESIGSATPTGAGGVPSNGAIMKRVDDALKTLPGGQKKTR